MTEGFYVVLSNNKIAKDVYELIVEGDVTGISAPGQFVNIKLDGFYLRRPISICDYSAPDERGVGKITLIYKVVGHGTESLSAYLPGKRLDMLCGLGNGYDMSKSGDKPLLIGGGVGVPPLYALCKKLKEQGKKPTVIIGFNTKDEVFYENEFSGISRVIVTTADGSYGLKGFVTDAMKDVDYTYFYTCGPMPMFRAIEKTALTSGQYSFEERMGCGFGACMGCSCKTKYKNKRICKDDPVLEREEIIW